MKFIILKGNLKDGLDAIARVVGDSQSTLPILKNILIQAADNRIKVSATNLELAVTAFVSGKIIEPGDSTVPLTIFSAIINNLQAERINIETEGSTLFVKTDNYEAKIQGMKAEEFPIIPGVTSEAVPIEIQSATLQDAVSFAVSAAQTTNARPELNGVFFNFEAQALILAATDSFRLAERRISNEAFTAEIRQGFKTIIPLKAIHEFIRIFKGDEDKVKLFFNHSQILFKSENVEMISRLTGGEFPDYEAIIPRESETELLLQKEELMQALKLTSSFADRLNEIRIVVKDKAKNIEVYAASQGLGENRYLIPAKVKGAPLEIIFNWRYLMDGLKGFAGKEIRIAMNGDARPVRLDSPGDTSSLYILMPIKVT